MIIDVGSLNSGFNPWLFFGQTSLFLVLWLLLILLLFWLLLFLIRALIRAANFVPAAFGKVILLVTIPKETGEEQNQKETIEQIRSQVALAETWFATLGGQRAQRGFGAWLLGRTDHFSLEMVCQHGLISFYLGVPLYLRNYMEQQLSAQYPEANLTEVEDYNIFSPQGVVVSGSLRLTRSYIFPIKTYQHLDNL